MISKMQTAMIAKALLDAGAVWTPYERQTLDANGMPSGEPHRVGCMVGLRYDVSQSRMSRLDIPGVILSDVHPMVVGILPAAVAAPQAGDSLITSDGKKRVLNAKVQDRLATLTIEA